MSIKDLECIGRWNFTSYSFRYIFYYTTELIRGKFTYLATCQTDFPEPLTLDRYRRPNGQVKPSNWTTTTVYVDTTGMPISFSKDYATPNSLHPDTNRPLVKAVSIICYA